MLVEKRVAGIIKWLERLKKSYTSGAIESALMDAECARADLENLRQVVWSEVRPSARQKSTFFEYVMNSVRTLSLAVIIVMLAVIPLSREVPAPEVRDTGRETVHTGPIIVIREYEPPVKQTERNETPQPRKQVVQKRPAPKRVQTTPIPETPADKTQTPAVKVPYDKVYSLIQTGQRALKNNSTVIKIK